MLASLRKRIQEAALMHGFIIGASSPGLSARPVPASGLPPAPITAAGPAAGSSGVAQIDP